MMRTCIIIVLGAIIIMAASVVSQSLVSSAIMTTSLIATHISPSASSSSLAPPNGYRLYLAGYSQQIATYDWNIGSGTIKPIATSDSGRGMPSFMAFTKDARLAYSTNEFADGVDGYITSYTVAANGQLQVINSVKSQGYAPAHIAIYPPSSASPRFIFVANYFSGTVASYGVNDSTGGFITTPVQVSHVGNNTHMTFITPDARYLFVPCLGSDYVAQYMIDATTGTFQANPIAARLIVQPGCGPRQLALHPNGRWMYLLCELGSLLVTLNYDAATGGLTSPVYYPTLPTPRTGAYNAGAVRVHPNGRFVYASNRAGVTASLPSSVAIFAIDGNTNMLMARGWQDAHGEIQFPRDMSFDPSGRWLVVANQKGNSTTILEANDSTGELTRRSTLGVIASPTYVGFVTV